jgi:hypothetical protein
VRFFDVAPDGADRVLDRRSYKDFAPTELVAQRLAKADMSRRRPGEGGACDETGPRLMSKSGAV